MIKFSKKQIFLGIACLVIALGFIGSTGSKTSTQTQQKTGQTQEQAPTTQVQGVKDEVKIASPKLSPTPSPSPKLASPKTITSAPTFCLNGTYVNSLGNTVCRPELAPSIPAGASAICGDGTYSFSQSRRGTCSHHGGVAQWL
jgi:hypothetical protein